MNRHRQMLVAFLSAALVMAFFIALISNHENGPADELAEIQTRSATATMTITDALATAGIIETDLEAIERATALFPRRNIIAYAARLIDYADYYTFSDVRTINAAQYDQSDHSPLWLVGLLGANLTLREAADTLLGRLGVDAKSAHSVGATSIASMIPTLTPNGVNVVPTPRLGGDDALIAGIYYGLDANSGELVGSGTLFDESINTADQRTLEDIESLSNKSISIVTASPAPLSTQAPTVPPANRH